LKKSGPTKLHDVDTKQHSSRLLANKPRKLCQGISTVLIHRHNLAVGVLPFRAPLLALPELKAVKNIQKKKRAIETSFMAIK